MLHTPVGRLRAIGLVEGTSYLLLLLIAMPLKYLADIPEPVTMVGWAHGVLFVAYVLAVLYAAVASRLSFGLIAAALVASVVPFGPFLIDRRLKRWEATR